MSRLDELPPDQRAALSLLLRQRKSYAEVAALLGIPERAVHDRAHAALAVLAPRQARELTAERREEIGDYLLGQQPGVAERLRTRTYLARSEPARGVGRASPRSSRRSARRRCRRSPPARRGARRAEPPPPRGAASAWRRSSAAPAGGAASAGRGRRALGCSASSRVGGALLLAAIVAAVIVAVDPARRRRLAPQKDSHAARRTTAAPPTPAGPTDRQPDRRSRSPGPSSKSTASSRSSPKAPSARSTSQRRTPPARPRASSTRLAVQLARPARWPLSKSPARRREPQARRRRRCCPKTPATTAKSCSPARPAPARPARATSSCAAPSASQAELQQLARVHDPGGVELAPSAPRSAAMPSAPTSRPSSGAWSRPTAWWWVIVPPPATIASPAACLTARHWPISSPSRWRAMQREVQRRARLIHV